MEKNFAISCLIQLDIHEIDNVLPQEIIDRIYQGGTRGGSGGRSGGGNPRGLCTRPEKTLEFLEKQKEHTKTTLELQQKKLKETMEQRTKKDSDKTVKKSLAQKERRLKIQIENNKRKLTQCFIINSKPPQRNNIYNNGKGQ